MSSIDDKVNFLTNNIQDLTVKHASFITVRVTKPPAPWLTDNLKLIFCERNRALKKYKLIKTQASWEEYNHLRNLALASVCREKAAYVRHISSSKFNRATLWSNLYTYTGLKNKSTLRNIPDHLCHCEKN